MLVALNTPEWKRLFAHPVLKKLYVSRRDVVGFVGKLNAPDHETYGACKLLCGAGYLAIFVLDKQLFLLVHSNCDLSPIEPRVPGVNRKPVIAQLRMSVSDIIKELAPIDRKRLGIETMADKKLTTYTGD